MRTAHASFSLVSVRSRNDLLQSGSVRIGGDVRRLTSVSIASVRAWPKGTFKNLAFLLKRVSREGGPRWGPELSYSSGRTS